MFEIITGVLIVFCAILGTPLFIIMTLAALAAFSFTGIEIAAVAQEFYRISSAPTLMTIPLFTFAGYLIAESQSPKRLLRLAEAALGWLPGGISIVAIIICAFFTAFTGASGVTIIALGGLIYPILMKDGYSEKYSLGMITATGSLGLLFPPSLPIILYGMVAKVDIDKLFKAGIVPGIILIIILSCWAIYNSPKSQVKVKHKFSFKEFISALKAAWPEALLPVAVLYGIYGGIVTVTEAAAFTAFYVFIIEVFIYRDINIFKDLPRIILDSMSLVGGILLILCCALGFTNFLVDQEVALKTFEWMKTFLHNKYSFLLFLNIFLLVVGCFMDIFSAIVVVVPLIVPIAAEFGVDPVHLAIIFLTNLEIGYLTPPVGINLFITGLRFKKSVTELYSLIVPYLILLIIGLLLITYIPSLTLFWFE